MRTGGRPILGHLHMLGLWESSPSWYQWPKPTNLTCFFRKTGDFPTFMWVFWREEEAFQDFMVFFGRLSVIFLPHLRPKSTI